MAQQTGGQAPSRARRLARAAAAGTAAFGPGATSAAAGAVGTAAGIQGAKALLENSVKAVVSVLRRLSRLRIARVTEWAGKQGWPEPVIAEALAEEVRREAEYAKKAEERARIAMKLALQAPDPSARAAGIQGAVRREEHYARLRGQAVLARVGSAVEFEALMKISPEGALWKLGPAEHHCPFCPIMANKVWPWSILKRLRIPLHYGCVCYLRSYGDALAAGEVGPGDLMSEAEAWKIAGPVIQAFEQGGEAGALAELQAREELAEIPGTDLNALATLPLKEELRPEPEEEDPEPEEED